jgi:hypothetical protein
MRRECKLMFVPNLEIMRKKITEDYDDPKNVKAFAN